jgi:predicted nucleic acid-binding protein
VRVALDTNVLASAIGTRGLCADVLRVVLVEHELVLGEHVLVELRRNLAKKFRLAPALIAETDALLREHSVVANGAALTGLPIDAADARVLGDALAGASEVFVTGDAELQALGVRAPVPVLSPRQVWMLLRNEK